jgi:hypothetical protein
LGLVHAKQVLPDSSCASSPYVFICFGDRMSLLPLPGVGSNSWSSCLYLTSSWNHRHVCFLGRHFTIWIMSPKFFLWDSVLLCSSGWPRTWNLPDSASQVLGL